MAQVPGKPQEKPWEAAKLLKHVIHTWHFRIFLLTNFLYDASTTKRAEQIML